jgi:hypothetical protein
MLRRSGAVVAVSPSAMEHVFPVECFCIARQMLSVCPYVKRERELGTECRFSARRRLSPLVRPISAGRFAQGHGRGSRQVTQVWFGIAPATVLTEGPSGTPRESLPEIPASPEKARFGKIAHVVS